MSLNDPQWGKRGRSGPPDLDEIWRNVNRRVNELFGRREPEDGDVGKPPRSSLPLGGVGLLVLLVLVVWLASGFYIVDEGRRVDRAYAGDRVMALPGRIPLAAKSLSAVPWRNDAVLSPAGPPRPEPEQRTAPHKGR